MTARPDTAAHRRLAALLVDALREELWPRYADRLRARLPRLQLRVRVGSGRATYHRDEGRGRHLIVFGWKMVAAKAVSRESAAGWTSGRELLRSGRRFDVLGVLTQAVCHEFAHLLQCVEGGRRRGSVHNAAFYAILAELFAAGDGERVRDFLVRACDGQPDLQAALVWPEADAAELTDGAGEGAGRRTGDGSGDGTAGATNGLWGAQIPALSADSPATLRFQAGDLVEFETRGRRIRGRVRRVNRRSVTVVPDRPERRGQYWRVGPTFLSHVDDDGVS
jgi:hypothetical protein